MVVALDNSMYVFYDAPKTVNPLVHSKKYLYIISN